MSSASDLAAEISQLIPHVKRGSLVVFGDIFGGHIDNIHSVVVAKALSDAERLVVEFNEGETLEVWDPGKATISSREFCISNATKVRWEWFYYGRPKIPENRFFIEHAKTSDVVVAATNATWGDPIFAPTIGRAARRIGKGHRLATDFQLSPDSHAVSMEAVCTLMTALSAVPRS
jgi:hypothetical protein